MPSGWRIIRQVRETSHSRNSFIEEVTQLLSRVEARREPISLKVSRGRGREGFHTAESPIGLYGKHKLITFAELLLTNP